MMVLLVARRFQIGVSITLASCFRMLWAENDRRVFVAGLLGHCDSSTAVRAVAHLIHSSI